MVTEMWTGKDWIKVLMCLFEKLYTLRIRYGRVEGAGGTGGVGLRDFSCLVRRMAGIVSGPVSYS